MFNTVDAAHRTEPARSPRTPSPAEAFAEKLIGCAPDRPTPLPPRLMTDPARRAHFIDAACAALMAGWSADRWCAANISVAMARLFALWQAAGRVAEPDAPRRSVTVIAPPDSSEVLGAVIKTDLFRAAGFSVRPVHETTLRATLDAVSAAPFDAAVVTGSRIGWSADEARAESVASALRTRFPDHPVHVGGRPSGPLREWPTRLNSAFLTAGRLSAQDRDTLAGAALAAVLRQRGPDRASGAAG